VSRRLTFGTIALLLGSSACSLLSSGTGALSGSSAPPAAAPGSLSGGILISPGGPGLAEAEESARQSCEAHGLQAKIGSTVSARGQIRLAYTCE
jgi:hypothetical protein